MKSLFTAACAVSFVFTAAAYAQDSSLLSADKADPAMKVATPDFAKAAMGSDLFEIRSSELALKKARTPDVKTFAEQMIKDHEKAEKDLHAALGDKDKKAMLAPKQAAMLKQLEMASDADFEPLYLAMQTHGHMEAVMLFRTYSGNGDNAKVKAFAVETRPVIEMHLDHVQKIVAMM